MGPAMGGYGTGLGYGMQGPGAMMGGMMGPRQQPGPGGPGSFAATPGYAGASVGLATMQPVVATTGLPPPAPVPQGPSEAERLRQLQEQLSKRVAERFEAFYGKAQQDHTELSKVYEQVQAGSGTIATGVRALQQELAQLRGNLEILTPRNRDLQQWLDTHPADTDSVPAVQLAMPSDGRQKDLLDAEAVVNALGDAVYQVEKQHMSGSLPLDQFLKIVRNLGREQFVRKAWLRKLAGFPIVPPPAGGAGPGSDVGANAGTGVSGAAPVPPPPFPGSAGPGSVLVQGPPGRRA